MRAALPVVTAMLLVAIVVAFGHSLDLRISDQAFDFATTTWLVDHESGPLRLMLYDGPKRMLVLLGLFLLTIVVMHRRLQIGSRARKSALFLLLCLSIVPSVTGAIKSASGVSCPNAIKRYGGLTPDRHGQFSFAGFVDPTRTDGCWPSGHVSGAFALLGILCLPFPGRRLLAALAMAGGAVMGSYQVMRGAHFASHIVVSFCIAIVVVTLLQRIVWSRGTEIIEDGDKERQSRHSRRLA